MHDSMQYDPIQGQGHEPFKVGNPAVFQSYLLRLLQWKLATDHGFLNYGKISKLVRAGFFIFGLVFVSRDFELGTNVSCEESTVSPLIFFSVYNSSLLPCFHFLFIICESDIWDDCNDKLYGITPGILIDKALKVACETPQSFRSLLCCSYSAVRKLSVGRSQADFHSIDAVCTNLRPLLHLFWLQFMKRELKLCCTAN